MKKKYLSLVLFLTIFLAFSEILFSQCPDPKKIVKNSGRDNFTVSTQSKSGALIPGGSYELPINVQEGFDYKVTTGTDDRGVLVPFEIVEMINEKLEGGGFKKTKKILKASNGDSPIIIKAVKTTVFTIIVTLPETQTEDESQDPECVGILVEDRKSTKIGF